MQTIPWLPFLALLVGSVVIPQQALAQYRWKAGVATVDITPHVPIWLAGYGMRTKPSEGVLRNIFVKALALQDESGATTVLVTSDLLGFPKDISDAVSEKVRDQYKLPRDRLALNASHTHSGPVTGNMAPLIYAMGPHDEEVVQRYTARLIEQVVEVIGTAIHNLAPAEVSFAQGFAGFAVNRRRAVMSRALPGPVDHDVPVLSVKAADGTLRAIVFGYACHNTVLADYVVNGDYAGFTQEVLEREHPGATAMFVQDCGADANPLPRRTVELARKYGDILAAAVDEVLRGKMRPQSGPIHAAFQLVDIPFKTPPSREELQARLNDKNPALVRHAKYMLSIYEKKGRLPDHYPYPVQVWQFGPGLKWIILGGEVVVDYSLRFKQQYGWDNTWVAGYSNDVFAYIPSLRVLKEGGYEGGGANIGYGQPGPFAEPVEEVIAAKVADLVRRTSAP